MRMHRKTTKECGVINGFHINISPFEEAKMVRCVSGSIMDVSLNPNTGDYSIAYLNDPDKVVFIPKGYAHAYKTLMENCIVEYCITGEYMPDKQITINPLTCGVNWS